MDCNPAYDLKFHSKSYSEGFPGFTNDHLRNSWSCDDIDKGIFSTNLQLSRLDIYLKMNNWKSLAKILAPTLYRNDPMTCDGSSFMGEFTFNSIILDSSLTGYEEQVGSSDELNFQEH